MNRVRIGTSGWSYKHWHDTFYSGVPVSRWLERYAEVFDCVELNGSFYRLPKRSTFVDWAARTPPDFIFAVKGSRFITHLKRLSDPHEHVDRFFEAATGLGRKLGPVLWQLPPSFSRNDAVLAEFLGALPQSVQHTVEFRHDTWLVRPVLDLLRQHNIALCVPDHPKLPKSLTLTSRWTYVRFHHGPTSDGNYPDKVLNEWSGWINDRLVADQAVWAFFNNDWNTFAPANALTLRRELSVASPAMT